MTNRSSQLFDALLLFGAGCLVRFNIDNEELRANQAAQFFLCELITLAKHEVLHEPTPVEAL